MRTKQTARSAQPRPVSSAEWHKIIQNAIDTNQDIPEDQSRHARDRESTKALYSMFKLALKNKDKDNRYMDLLADLYSRARNGANDVLHLVQLYGSNYPYYMAKIIARAGFVSHDEFDATSLIAFTEHNLKFCKHDDLQKWLLNCISCLLNHWKDKKSLLALLNNQICEYPQTAAKVMRVMGRFFHISIANCSFKHDWIGYLIYWVPSLVQEMNGKALHYWKCIINELFESREFEDNSLYFDVLLQVLTSFIMASKQLAFYAAQVLLCMAEQESNIEKLLVFVSERVFQYASLDNMIEANDMFGKLLSESLARYSNIIPTISKFYYQALEKPQTVAQFKLLCVLMDNIPNHGSMFIFESLLSRFFNGEFDYLPQIPLIAECTQAMKSQVLLSSISPLLLSKYFEITLDVIEIPESLHVRPEI